MLKRSLAFIACAAALVACGPAAETSAPAPETSDTAAVAVRVSDVACEMTMDTDFTPAGTSEIYTEIISPGDDVEGAVGIAISAAPGSTCTGPVANTLTCVVTAPKVAITIQDVVTYAIPEGRTATVTHDAQGQTACFLNEAAG